MHSCTGKYCIDYYLFANFYLQILLSDFILDCCNSTSDGANDYKGKYWFPKALAGNKSWQNCIHGSIKAAPSSAFVRCIPNMEIGPYYGPLNVTLCQAKYDTTNKLENLEKVDIFLHSYFAGF